MKNMIVGILTKAKITTAIMVILLMASIIITMPLVMKPVQAQEGPHGGSPGGAGFGFTLQPTVPLPAGVTPDFTITSLPFLSISPNPIGVGQTILVNMWINPPIHYTRYLTGFTVTLTKPDGTVVTVGPLNSYQGDATSWFQYTVDQVGLWKAQFNFPGGYYSAVNVTGFFSGVAQSTPTTISLGSAYYTPATSPVTEFVVQQGQVFSWPPSPLPTDYWTRPVSPMNREWAPILGNFPYTGYMTDPPANTNPYASNYKFTPYVQAPNTAHILWRQEGAAAGLVGTDKGAVTIGTGGGTPTIIYMGRCYQTFTMPSASGTMAVNYWRCFDLRTGQLYWQVPLANGETAPTAIDLDSSNPEVAGEEAYETVTPYLITITAPTATDNGRLIKYNPWSGQVAYNLTGPPPGVTAGTFYRDPYVLSIQTINAAKGQYRLINWTVVRNVNTAAVNVVTAGGFVTDNFTARIMSNITWPFATLGTCDFNAGIAVAAITNNPILSIDYGIILQCASLSTGQLLWNITDPNTTESSSTLVVDQGKVAIAEYGTPAVHYVCYNGLTGQKLWTSDPTDYPWGEWTCYGAASYGGMIIDASYGGIYAFDWNTGKLDWKYQAPAVAPFESAYAESNGTTVYPFFATVQIADGKIYAYNTEHTASQPYTRGWELHCINASTGLGIWKITGTMAPGAIADGYLTASNPYDGYMYIYGKGLSATAVSAPQSQITTGQNVVISGTVLDKSPGDLGSFSNPTKRTDFPLAIPCVSDASMEAYMEYLYMQYPIDGIYHNLTISGVPVSIDAIDPNSNAIHIATVTTDGTSGTFGYTWTPTIPGQYKVTATFAGDDSYGSSWATTYATVSQVSSATSTPPATQAQATDYTMTIIGTGIAVIIAVAIATVIIVLLRKRP